MKEDPLPDLEVLDWGRADYGKALSRQKALVEERISGSSADRLVLVEHPPVVTLGRSGSAEDLRISQEALRQKGIDLYYSDRGGMATFHGPGQLVVYPILKLGNKDLHLYVKALQNTVAWVLRDYDLEAEFRDGNPGVWVNSAKVASIGLAVRGGVTYHGVALNVSVDPEWFRWIIPCGQANQTITSMERELGYPLDREEVKDRFVRAFCRTFHYVEPCPVDQPKEVPKMSLTNEQMIGMYRTMIKIRMFEEQVAQLFAGGKIPGFVHLYAGEEAVAAGVCAALRDTDYITSTHRGHGHLIAKGGDIKLMMAELFGKKTGYCKGKGGSMHIADIDLGILGANGIVGGGPPLATGAALAAQYQGKDTVTVCFFGDGAANQGTTHEAMNLATCWKLPVVFVNENNMYGISSCTMNSMCVADIADRAAAYDMPGVVIDGNDVMAVYEAALEAIKRARGGEGPSLVECKTYRFRGHFEGDPCAYRSEEEVMEWKGRDPIPRFEKKLLEMQVLTPAAVSEVRKTMEKSLVEAVRFAEESAFPEPGEILEDVYTL